MNVIDAKCVIEVGLPNQWKIGENITGAPKFKNNQGAVKLLNFSILRYQYWFLLYCSLRIHCNISSFHLFFIDISIAILFQLLLSLFLDLRGDTFPLLFAIAFKREKEQQLLLAQYTVKQLWYKFKLSICIKKSKYRPK